LRRRRCQEKGWKRKCKSKRAEVGAKTNKAKRELESKLLPFSWFLFSCFLVSFVFFMFEKKKMTQECAIVIFCGGGVKKKKMMAMCRHFFSVVLLQ
jgi:hypothetical protein